MSNTEHSILAEALQTEGMAEDPDSISKDITQISKQINE